MFGNNLTIVEFRLHEDPQASTKAEVVSAKAFMSQGKKEDNKKPMFFKLVAWKYSGRVLMGLQQKKLYMAVGRWSMEYWGDNNEKSGLVFTAEDFGEKLFAPGPNQGYQNNHNQGYQNQGQQQGYQQQQGNYQNSGMNGAPSDSDIPFACNIV